MNTFQKPWLAATVALGLLAACNQGTESTEIESPEPPASQAADSGAGFHPLQAIGLSKPEVPPATLAAGQRVQVRTTSTLSTKSNSSGETFTGTLAEPVMDGDRVVFSAGAPVTGRIAFADKGGRVKGVAKIGLEVTEIDGVNVSTKSYVAQAKKTHTKDAQKIGIGAGAGAIIGAITGGGSGAAKGAGVGAGAGTGVVLATHGDPAVIPAESTVWFELSQPVTVNL
ncbi:MAG: hypothetical protein GC160_17635 [Acidobacteria bacterium]|nr:hypothetical protein [Acidobacteriota bacterium]